MDTFSELRVVETFLKIKERLTDFDVDAYVANGYFILRFDPKRYNTFTSDGTAFEVRHSSISSLEYWVNGFILCHKLLR